MTPMLITGAVPDSDGDGVPDASDQLRLRLSGKAVDANEIAVVNLKRMMMAMVCRMTRMSVRTRQSVPQSMSAMAVRNLKRTMTGIRWCFQSTRQLPGYLCRYSPSTPMVARSTNSMKMTTVLWIFRSMSRESWQRAVDGSGWRRLSVG